MLTEILSKNTCAGCKICCNFLPSEHWEMPVITDSMKALVSERYGIRPEYDSVGGNTVFRHIPVAGTEFVRCPMLMEKGCLLGDDKPFECKIWPFRATKLGDKVAITVSYFCESVSNLPLSSLRRFYDEHLKDKIVSAVSENPGIVKPYIESYPIVGIIDIDI